MPFPILYRRKPLRGLKRWLTFLAPGSFFVYVTKRDSLTALLALSLKGILKPAMPDKYWFKFRHPLSQLL